MKEEYKTKEQLINELVEMRKRITHLEKLKEKHEQMDRALKESEEKFRTLAEQSPNMIFINKKSRVLYANKKCEEIMGYTKDEFYAPDFDYLDLISPEYIDLVRESYNRHTKGEDVAPYEFALLTKEGERVEAIITTKLIDYEGEKAILGIVTDIRKYKRAEMEKEWLISAISHCNDGVSITDREDQYIYVNEAHAQIYGYSSEELLGKTWYDLIPPEMVASSEKIIKETLHNKEVGTFSGEIYALRKDKTLLPTEVKAKALWDREGNYHGHICVIRDISERKRAEEMLRESEMRYRTTIDSMADPIHVVDRDLKFVLFNKAFTKWNEELGLEKDALGRQLFEVFPFLSERVSDEYRRVFETGEILVTEERTEFGGKKFITETRKIPVFDEGKITRVVTVIRDITEQKRTGDVLRKSEERYRLLFKKSKDVVYVTTLEGKLVDINPAGVELFGYSSKDELLKMNIGKELYFNPDDRQKFQQVIERQDYVKDFELILKKKNGEKIIVLVTSTSIRDEKGNIIGYQGIMRDITEHKRAEESLIESEEKYRILINNIQDGVFIIQDAKMQFVNEAFTKIFGYATEELIGKDFRQLIAPEDLEMVTERYFRRQAGDDVPREYEFRVLHKDGITRVTVNMVVGLINYCGRMASMGTLKDITARKRAEESLQESFENLRKVLQGTILAMAKIVEMRDPYTAGHQQRVTKLSSAIAQEMGLSEQRIDALQMAALIHDVGKIYIPAEILSRPGQLSEIETSLIRTHPQVGYDILRTIEFLWPMVEIVLQHHERMNGSGYPKGLTGEDILMEAKILGVADVVEAMSFHRPYRSAMGIGKALEEISQNKGILYDPQVADVCFKLFYEKGFKFE